MSQSKEEERVDDSNLVWLGSFNPDKSLLESDSIFHYTTRISGLRILGSGNILLSERKNSNDPIESLRPSYNLSWSGSSDEHSDHIRKETEGFVENIYQKILNQISSTRQLCFCQNKLYDDGSIKEFGFLKPRMWDNYGEKYMGVCLVFSKSKLVETIQKHELHIIKSDVSYTSYWELRQNHFRINLNEVLSNPSEYETRLRSLMNKRLFSKHIDYQGENEFRLISFDEGRVYIPISNCLTGVIVSFVGLSPGGDFKFFKDYSTENSINLYHLNWEDSDPDFHPM